MRIQQNWVPSMYLLSTQWRSWAKPKRQRFQTSSVILLNIVSNIYNLNETTLSPRYWSVLLTYFKGYTTYKRGRFGHKDSYHRLTLKHDTMYLKLCFIAILFAVVCARPSFLDEEQGDSRGKSIPKKITYIYISFCVTNIAWHFFYLWFAPCLEGN